MKNLQNQSPIIIAGMHRSGTSLIANLINKCGVFVGKKLSSNFESVYFQNVNQSLLDLFGCGVLCIDNLPTHELLTDQANALKNIYLKKIKKKIWPLHFGLKDQSPFEIPMLWGWKDPRNALFLPFYHYFFPHARIIGIVRDEKDVAISLLRREEQRFDGNFEYPKKDIRKRINQYIQTARQYNQRLIKGMSFFNDKILIRYEAFVQSPDVQLSNLLKSIRLPVPANIKTISQIVECNRTNVYLQPDSKRYIQEIC
jgi:hypothetical protein